MSEDEAKAEVETEPVTDQAVGNWEYPLIFEFIKVLFLIVATITALALFFTILNHLIETIQTGKPDKYESFRNLMLGIAALIGGPIGFYLSWRRTKALDHQANAEMKQAETAAKQAETAAKQAETASVQAELANKRHESEAFAKAIEQLGDHEYPSIRLGAVYSLEALAKSSETLHGPIMETFCAYIRGNRAIDSATIPSEDWLENLPTHESICSKVFDYKETLERPDELIQAILTVIGRRNIKNDPNGFRLNLKDTDLRNLNFSHGHFERADFIDSRLDGSKFFNTHLEQSLFHSTHLEGVFFSYAFIQGALFKSAKFICSWFDDIHIDKETNFCGANLTNVRNLPQGFRETVQSDQFTIWPEPDEPEDVDIAENGEKEDDTS